MSETESVEVDSGVTEVAAGNTDVVDIGGIEVVGGDIVVDVDVVVVEVVVEVVVVERGRTGSIGSPFPATAAS